MSLIVTVQSFSYKSGIPVDGTEHGGGYVFDCRAIANPGRDERFKNRTGLCPDVIQYLNSLPEAQTFKDHCFGLVRVHAQAYLQRGFEKLSVCFGCTGGQHRSVYMAEALAKEFLNQPGIAVKLIHRELDKHPEWDRA